MARRSIFISYSGHDKQVADEVRNQLIAADYEVVGDWNLVGGVPLKGKLDTLLRESDLVVVLLTPNSLSSQYVMYEIGSGYAYQQQNGSPGMIPIIVDGEPIPPMIKDLTVLMVPTATSQEFLQKLLPQIPEALKTVDATRQTKEELDRHAKEEFFRQTKEELDRQDYRQKIGLKLSRWFLFGILIAVLPFGLNHFLLGSEGRDASLAELLKRGDLHLVSLAICFGGIGELIGPWRKYIAAKILFIFLTLVSLVTATAFFVQVSLAVDTPRPIPPDQVALYSVVVFVTSLILGGFCIWLSEEK